MKKINIRHTPNWISPFYDLMKKERKKKIIFETIMILWIIAWIALVSLCISLFVIYILFSNNII